MSSVVTTKTGRTPLLKGSTNRGVVLNETGGERQKKRGETWPWVQRTNEETPT